jgi:serine/threonine protein kinase
MKQLFKNQADADDSRNFSLVGTEEYIAPETLDDVDVSYTADLWSVGVILY